MDDGVRRRRSRRVRRENGEEGRGTRLSSGYERERRVDEGNDEGGARVEAKEDAKRLRVVFARLSSRSDGGTVLRAKRRRSDESVEPREEVGRRESIVDARGETVGDGGVESGRAGARGRNVFRWREVDDATIINKEL